MLWIKQEEQLDWTEELNRHKHTVTFHLSFFTEKRHSYLREFKHSLKLTKKDVSSQHVMIVIHHRVKKESEN